jgi:HEAT repeat protein
MEATAMNEPESHTELDLGALDELTEKIDIDGLINLIENTKAIDSETKNTVASAIYELGELKADKAVDLLIYIALTNKWAKIRHSAISALGKIGNKKTIKPFTMMLKALKDVDNDGVDLETSFSVAGWIFEALFNIGTKQAISSIVEALNDNSELTDTALSVIKELGGTG